MTKYGLSRSQALALVLSPFIFVVMAVLFVIVVVVQGRPFFYTSIRMRDADTEFRLYKIRTMKVDANRNERAFGGDAKDRVSRMGAFLRRTRLDELPQIINVLKGDICFIGPRPPLRSHVQAFPDKYRQILDRTQPGITGLATVTVHRREERIMAGCHSPIESEDTYYRRCLPIKLRLDSIYAERRNLRLDVFILWRTFARLDPGFAPLRDFYAEWFSQAKQPLRPATA